MRIYRKEADEVQLIAFPDEHVHKGDYFVIEDQAQSRGLLVQAIDLQYANVPGVLEDILRDVMTDGELSGEDVDPLNISSQVDALKDTGWRSARSVEPLLKTEVFRLALPGCHHAPHPRSALMQSTS